MFDADREQEARLKLGADTWNAWRADNPGVEIKLNRAFLGGANLDGVDLSEAQLLMADLSRCSLVGAKLDGARLDDARMEEADLSGATMVKASLRGAHLRNAKLDNASLRSSVLWRADLWSASLRSADLGEARLRDANLSNVDAEGASFNTADLHNVRLSGARLVGADLRYAYVYGVSAWDVDLTGAQQDHLRVTRDDMGVTVDDLALAQTVHFFISGPGVARLLSATTKRIVLILGRFSEERKPFLEIVRDFLGHLGYVPIVFDFDVPDGRDVTETVRAIAHMARFIVADLTDPRSVPQELTTIVPILPSVPLVPVIETSQEPWGMFNHFSRFPWVLPVQRIPGRGSAASPDEFVRLLMDNVVLLAEEKLLGEPPEGSIAPDISAPPRVRFGVLKRYMEKQPDARACATCGAALTWSYDSPPNANGLWETFCSRCGTLNGVPKRASGRGVQILAHPNVQDRTQGESADPPPPN